MSQLITIALLGLLVIILVPLLAPVRVQVVFTPERSRIRTQWMLQYVEYQFPERVQVFGFWRWVLYRRPLRPRRPREKKPPVKEKKPKKHVPISTRARIAWYYRVIVRRTLLIAVRFVGRVLRSFHLQEGRVAMTMGLSDPAHTGMMTGLWFAVQPAVRQRFRRVDLTLTPDFNRSIMRVDGFFKLRMIPVEPIFHLVRALGTLPWRGLWKLKKAWSS
jgi:hypothetical protein